MKVKTITLIVFVSAIVLLMTASCSSYRAHPEPVVITDRSGPPAHAPAHGYRRKHVQGVEVVFDSGLGVYVVVGLSDHYYHDGYFYRLNGGIWEMSVKPEGSWKIVATTSLPMGLQAKAVSKGSSRGKGNDNNKGKANGRGKGKGRGNKDVVSMGKKF